MPDQALASIMRQLSTSTGMTVRMVHPGRLREDEARRAFDGMADDAIELLAVGEPHISLESDDLLIAIEREIVTAMIQRTAPLGTFSCWAAFACPDGRVEVVLPRAGLNVVHEAAGRSRAA